MTDNLITVAKLAAAVGMSTAPERVAWFAGCFTQHDPRTGRLPLPGQGQGMDATFTREQAARLIAEWHSAAWAAEDGRIEPAVEAGAGLDLAAADRRHGSAVAEVRERYRPGPTLAELGARRASMREELTALTARLEAVAKAELAAGKSESLVAREAQVDRMTVRKWAGKR